ncbi:hypothetical protein BLOT_000032, partial [Blomia tropicalis]
SHRHYIVVPKRNQFCSNKAYENCQLNIPSKSSFNSIEAVILSERTMMARRMENALAWNRKEGPMKKKKKNGRIYKISGNDKSGHRQILIDISNSMVFK